VPRLNLSSSSLAPGPPQRHTRPGEAELSAEHLPLRQLPLPPDGLGEDTMAELAIQPPTLGDDTDLSIECSQEEVEAAPRDFLAENLKVCRREGTGRASAASSAAAQPRHRAGAVPRYLKVRGGGGWTHPSRRGRPSGERRRSRG
jgi:hypothetical protein